MLNVSEPYRRDMGLLQMTRGENRPICFVIGPLGDEGSEIRQRADKILKHIIGPPLKECGYRVLRADKISEPGLITTQVMRYIIEAPLLVADLTGGNPNVFYELSFRHALRRPALHIVEAGERLPFDIAPSRTVFVDSRDLDSVARAKRELAEQIRSAERNPADHSTPISVALEYDLREGSSQSKSNAKIMSMLEETKYTLEEIRVGVLGKISVRDRSFVLERLRNLSKLIEVLCDIPSRLGPLGAEGLDELGIPLAQLCHEIVLLAERNKAPQDLIDAMKAATRRAQHTQAVGV